MMNSKVDDGRYSEAEAAARRDAVVKHMLNKPPQPHSEMKIGKRAGKRKAKKRQAKIETPA